MGIGKKLNYFELANRVALGPQLIDRLPQPCLQKRGTRRRDTSKQASVFRLISLLACLRDTYILEYE